MISVVIPAWNAARTLPETLASIAAQTRRAEEVLVVDDASTDGTGAIARAAGSRVLRIDRGGVAGALNAGIAASAGSLIAILDSDDLWTPDKLELQEAALAADPRLDGVLGHVRCFADPLLNGALQVPDGARPGWLQGAALIRRAPMLAVGPFDPAMGGGAFIQWVDRARHLGLHLMMCPETVLLRRIRHDSQASPSAQRDTFYLRVARDAIRRRRTFPAAATAD